MYLIGKKKIYHLTKKLGETTSQMPFLFFSQLSLQILEISWQLKSYIIRTHPFSPLWVSLIGIKSWFQACPTSGFSWVHFSLIFMIMSPVTHFGHRGTTCTVANAISWVWRAKIEHDTVCLSSGKVLNLVTCLSPRLITLLIFNHFGSWLMSLSQVAKNINTIHK